MKLLNIKEIKGKIKLKTGLHIGAGDVEMHIGGTDNPVIKQPNTLEPYIPGSSLKGKVRSLLEMRSGLMGKTDGKPLQASHLSLQNLDKQQKEDILKILKLFGSSGADAEEIAELGPTRVSFADCLLSEDYRKKVREERLSLSEVKSENTIDRIRGVAQHPRFTERVPADTEFEFSVHLKMLGDDEEDLIDYLLQGLKLLQMDSLGGSGSRGYGKVVFDFDDQEIENRFDNINPFGIGGNAH